jgi:GAF domain-containing protein
MRLDALPESLRRSLLTGEPAELVWADEATWRALDMPARAGGLYALPLRARGELEGALVVAADRPLDAELKDDLQTLADLAALAVEGMELRATGQPG